MDTEEINFENKFSLRIFCFILKYKINLQTRETELDPLQERMFQALFCLCSVILVKVQHWDEKAGEAAGFLPGPSVLVNQDTF